MTDQMKLNSAQTEAVTHDRGPLLIIAGAGTGKTTVITERISYLIQNQYCQPNEILALTFTDKAAEEMEERVDMSLPYGYVDLWISTFHSFGEKILKAHGIEIGLPNDFKLLNETGQWLLMRQNLAKFELDYYKPAGNPTKFIHALIKHFSRAKDENITPLEYQKFVDNLKAEPKKTINTLIDEKAQKQLSKSELDEVIELEIKKYQEIATAYKVYQQLLLDSEAMDFGDLINYCLKLFKERKNILAKYREQFKYVLVDEFQDTNYAQFELIKLLSEPKRNITVVGDDDQSIYKFRGASVSNIMQFKDEFPNTKEVFLNQNYRSKQNILDLSYKFIQQNNPNRLEIKLAKDGMTKKLISPQKGQAEIKHLHGEDINQEVANTINKIIEIKNNNPELGWSDFAILSRSNSAVKDFTYELEHREIPHTFLASRGLYGKAIVLDIIAYLKLLDNYHESSATYRVLSMPTWNINIEDLINLNYWSRRKSLSLYEVINRCDDWSNISNSAKEQIAVILKMIETHSQLVKEKKNITEIIQVFLEDSGYLKYLTSNETIKKREELNYLNQFYKKIQDLERDSNSPTASEILNLLELEIEAGDEGSLSVNMEETGPDTVKVMTIHTSKGLEFKYVFVVNMVAQRFPTNNRRDPIELPEPLIKEIIPEGDIHIQEERRLFYVAMTRAKEGLYLTSADNYGGTRKKKLSQFLIELDDKLFEIQQSEKIEKAESKNKVVKEEDIDESYQPPKKFSFTQLQDYNDCPYKYRFKYVLKVPTKGSKNFSYGNTIHNTLQKFFQLTTESGKPTLDDLLGIYQDSFIDDWYPDKETKSTYYQKGLESLETFYKLYKEKPPEVKFIEYPFTLKIKDGKDIISISGKIDRVDQTGKSVRIVDYKTGKAKDQLQAEDKEQLLIYQMATEDILKEVVGELIFYYLDNNQKISFLGTEKDTSKVREKIINSVRQIKSRSFSAKPKMGARSCQWCDFNSICDFREY
jgi:DNA helicase II / ATP-dependent DNA helicase PcrA